MWRRAFVVYSTSAFIASQQDGSVVLSKTGCGVFVRHLTTPVLRLRNKKGIVVAVQDMIPCFYHFPSKDNTLVFTNDPHQLCFLQTCYINTSISRHRNFCFKFQREFRRVLTGGGGGWHIKLQCTLHVHEHEKQGQRRGEKVSGDLVAASLCLFNTICHMQSRRKWV